VRRALLVLGVLLLLAPRADAAAPRPGGCYDLRSGASTAEPRLRFEPTGPGTFLLYTDDRHYLGQKGAPHAEPSPAVEWRVRRARGAVVLVNREGERMPGRYTLRRARGCARYPDADADVDGRVSRGARPWAQTRGLLDSHLHWMAEEAFGGRAHCGRPWHRYGVAYAMVDCPDHEPGRPGLAFENVLSGNSPGATHDTTGWPTFADWPRPTSLTHEGTYHRWVERAWRGGLRLAVVLFFDNAQLCGVWPSKAHPCDEMETVRRQIADLRDLQRYLDARAGGPGRGWMRIVTDPFQARRVINQGKLAVVIGIETSRLFDCRIRDGVPGCDANDVDRELARAQAAGIRSLEITGKFDNGFSGVAGDPGSNGVVTNNGNRLETGRYLDMGTCERLPSGAVDKPQVSFGEIGEPLSLLVGGAAPGAAPVYPPPPHCNRLGLTDVGEHLVNRIVDRRMLMDPDHMSAAGRIAALDVFERRGYSGVLSSHSWSTPVDEPRILRLGGVVIPKASAIGVASTSDWFVSEYRRLRRMRDRRYLFGFGFGSDMNGVAKQPVARPDAPERDPVTYPFRSYDGRRTIRQSTAGERTWDFNVDGVAHYGLYLDWLEELRGRLGRPFVRDMLRGPEAYLQMWERAVGVPSAPRPERARVGMSARRLLRAAGQPRVRGARAWRYRDGTVVRLSRAGRAVRVER
jgi:microsomal dipeptidase-like Zn-dependent dipeptidase